MVISHPQSPSSVAISADKRPSDLEYALLSREVYKGATLKQNDRLPDNRNWRIQEVLSGASDYVGAIYINHQTQQVVLAHRGTHSLGALLEDFKGVYLPGLSPQKQAVFDAIDNAITLAQDEGYHLSFTGHSLGAFLAELSVYYCHRSKAYPEVNAVTFESPGVQESLEELQANLDQGKIDLAKLDIISYLSYPNLVNTCNHHVGTCYALEPDLGNYGWVHGWHLQQVHSIGNIVALLQDPEHVAHYVLDWPIGNQRKHFFKHATFNQGIYTLTEPKPVFALDYQGHYRLHDTFTHRNSLPLIHFSPALQSWLKDFYQAMIRYQRVANLSNQALADTLTQYAKENFEGATGLDYLIGNSIIRYQNKTKIFLNILTNISVADVRQKLSTWLQENSEAAGKLLGFLAGTALQQKGSIEASLIEGGGEVTHQFHIDQANVRGTVDKFPEDTNPVNIEHLKDLRQHFLKSVADSGVKIKAFGIAKDVKFGGTIGKMDVAASVMEVVPRAQRVESTSLADQINRQRSREGLAQPSITVEPDAEQVLSQLEGKKTPKMRHIR